MRLEIPTRPADPGGPRRRTAAARLCLLFALAAAWALAAPASALRGTRPATVRHVRLAPAAAAAAPARTFSIAAEALEHGRVFPSGRMLVAAGSDPVFRIVPDEGYRLDALLVDGVPVRRTGTLVLRDIRASHRVMAAFSPNEYVIIATAAPHVTIAPSGVVPVMHGESRTFTFSADSGHAVREVLVDGIPVRAQSRYTFSNVSAHHRIHVRTSHHAARIIAPEPGELWLAGETREVRWQPLEHEDADSAEVLVSYHGPDGPWESIWLGSFRNGSAQWEVPDTSCDSLVVCVATRDTSASAQGLDYSNGLVRVRSSASSARDARFFVRAVPSPVAAGPVRLDYSLPIPGEATLEIYTVSGREVWRRPLGFAPAGTRSATWDGRLGGGQLAEPGVYFARLVTTGGTRRCRLVLLPP